MKPLILILLSVLTAEAQATGPTAAPWLAQFARQERERRVQDTSKGRVYTSEDARRGAPPAPAAPTRSASAAPAKPAGAEAPKPVQPAPDPAKEWSARLAEQRAKVRELMDNQVALELQVAQFTNQFLAPVTDSKAQQAALSSLTEAQTKLDETKRELITAQSKLRELEGTSPR